MDYIVKKYGHEGYSVWYQILEQLGDADFHYLDLRDDMQLMLLSGSMNTSEETLIQILDDLSKLDAINKILWEKSRVVFSEKFVSEITEPDFFHLN